MYFYDTIQYSPKGPGMNTETTVHLPEIAAPPSQTPNPQRGPSARPRSRDVGRDAFHRALRLSVLSFARHAQMRPSSRPSPARANRGRQAPPNPASSRQNPPSLTQCCPLKPNQTCSSRVQPNQTGFPLKEPCATSHHLALPCTGIVMPPGIRVFRSRLVIFGHLWSSPGSLNIKGFNL
jgi:hypothetical protein